MYKNWKNQYLAILLFALAISLPCLNAQELKSTLAGTVKDTTGAVLQGARIDLEPAAAPTATDVQGNFAITALTPGSYKISVSFVGFETSSTTVELTPGHVKHIDIALKVASNKQDVTVYADREHGDAVAVNREFSSENILNVLPSDVIKSLPNANIADAVGRLPGVTLERDEGEGKYVQIRGTEPRLSNVTIDGINMPSPEAGVRQVKLDVIPSDIVESVEINKTLSANQDGDAIGGSVNLVTKLAGEYPTISAYGLGGVTPIFDTRHVSEYGITVGKRYGANHKFGILGGFTYDYNGRGIDDIEPQPDAGTLAPTYDSIDLREYRYDRTRYGFAGSADYKINEASDLYARGMYSDFKDWGDKWVYTLNDVVTPGATPSDPATFAGDKPKYSNSKRLPDYGIASLALGGKHVFRNSWFSWEITGSRGRQLAAAGNPGDKFKPLKHGTIPDFAAANCAYDPGATVTPNRPQWQPACTASGSPVFDPTQYQLTELDLTSGQTTQLNLQGSASYARNYTAAGHFGTFEAGFKIRNAHKGQFAFSPVYDNLPGGLLMSQFLSPLHNDNYYEKSYRMGPLVDYNKITAFQRANPTLFVEDIAATHLGSDASNFNLQERITAGYVMNTITFGKFHLQTGLRFEATNEQNTGYLVANDSDGNYISTTPVHGTGSYIDPLPSVQLRYNFAKDTDLRAVYGRGIARPNPQDLIPSVTEDQSTNPYTISLGNPNLKAEYANNYDLLFEKFLNPLGLIQAGFFYKDLSQPIVSIVTIPTTGAYSGNKVSQPNNAGSAWVTGFEIAYQQRLSYLPGVLGGLGFSGNYSYTASKATGVDPLRTDSPALLRQAPNTWNLSPTYDRGPLSVRMGLSYNQANIYAYQYENLAYATDANGNPISVNGKLQTVPNPQVGNQAGPVGDNYLYTHLQTDAQAAWRLPRGFTLVVSGLNLNNEVFGFYNGSPQYVVQREYYAPTFSAGLRWSSTREK